MIEEVNNIYANMKSTNLLRLGVYHGPTTRTGVAYLIKLFYRLYTSQNRDDGVRSDGASTNYGNIMNHEEPRMNGITATERLINDFWGTFYLSSFSPDFQDWDSLSSPRDESGVRLAIFGKEMDSLGLNYLNSFLY